MLTAWSIALNASSYRAFNRDICFFFSLVEKATIRPAKSMDSLCSVPVEGEMWPSFLGLGVTAGRPEVPHQTRRHKQPGLLRLGHSHAQSPGPEALTDPFWTQGVHVALTWTPLLHGRARPLGPSSFSSLPRTTETTAASHSHLNQLNGQHLKTKIDKSLLPWA